MKHIIFPVALFVALTCTPSFAGGLFAGDDNMHVQGHPYESTSYHKAFHGADSFETLPVQFAGYGHYRAQRGYGYGHGYGYSRGYASHASYGHFGGGYGGHGYGGCGCGCKKHSLFGWFKKGCGCGSCGCESDCGCEEPSCCKSKCHKSLFSWFKKGCGCGCGDSGCDSCGGDYEGTAEEMMPEPVDADAAPVEADAPPVPSQASAQFRSILPPAEVVSPASVLFPFFAR